MSDLVTIYVVRHGESLGNLNYEKGIGMDVAKEGGVGTPLSEEGVRQVDRLVKEISDVHLDAVYSSHLLRAVQTAEAVAESKGLEVIIEANIHERFFGKFPSEGKWTREMREEAKKAIEDLEDEEKLLHKYFEDGESGLDAVNRFLGFLSAIAPLYTGKAILVVNHGNVIRSLLVHKKFATYDELPSGVVDNTGYFVVETDGKDIFNVVKTVRINLKK